MSTYVHHIPGRLRVRSGTVRRDESRAAAVKRLLSEQPGVRSVEPNTLTGSIVVNYDPAATTHDAVLELLCDRGYLSQTAAPRVPLSASALAPSPQVAQDIAKKVATSLVEAAVERSLLALVAAMI